MARKMPKMNIAQRLEAERQAFLERGKKATGTKTADETGARPLARQRYHVYLKELEKYIRKEEGRRRGERAVRTLT